MTPDQIREVAGRLLEDSPDPEVRLLRRAALAYADVLKRSTNEYRVVDKDGAERLDSQTENLAYAVEFARRLDSIKRQGLRPPHRVEVRSVGEWREVERESDDG